MIGQCPAKANLILIRHGQSLANAADRFAGWLDVPLTASGEREARDAGNKLREAGLVPDVVHTSVLERAIKTAELALESSHSANVPMASSWRLNERHYGGLQGLRKSEAIRKYGVEQVQRWRRGFRDVPPPAPLPAPCAEGRSIRSESLEQVATRLLPYWRDVISPDLQAGRTVWVVAHGNSLRMVIRALEGLDSSALDTIVVRTGAPVGYRVECADGSAPRVVSKAMI